jgi:mannose-6-phosphate isomerase-like protein (cupin superfamily)
MLPIYPGTIPEVPDAIAPDGSEIYFRVVDAQRASLVEVVQRPGCPSRPMRHRTVEEIWYFLAGSGEVWLRSPDGTVDSTQRVEPGETVTIPTGWAFQFRAIGEEPLRFLCYTSPPWPGDDEAAPVAEGGLGLADQ